MDYAVIFGAPETGASGTVAVPIRESGW